MSTIAPSVSGTIATTSGTTIAASISDNTKLVELSQEQLKEMILASANSHLPKTPQGANAKQVANIQPLSDEKQTKEILLLREDGKHALVLIKDTSKNAQTAVATIVEKNRIADKLSNRAFTNVTIKEQQHVLGQNPSLIQNVNVGIHH